MMSACAVLFGRGWMVIVSWLLHMLSQWMIVLTSQLSLSHRHHLLFRGFESGLKMTFTLYLGVQMQLVACRLKGPKEPSYLQAIEPFAGSGASFSRLDR